MATTKSRKKGKTRKLTQGKKLQRKMPLKTNTGGGSTGVPSQT